MRQVKAIRYLQGENYGIFGDGSQEAGIYGDMLSMSHPANGRKRISEIFKAFLLSAYAVYLL